MKALTAIAATAYAIGLWMFAPESVWRCEVEQAKRNQRQSDTTSEPDTAPTPEPATVPTPELITETEELLPDTEPDTTPEEPEQTTESIPESVQEPQQLDYNQWTTTQLREEAKERKLNWRPLINGKRTPLKKPDLIALLTA